MDHIEECGMTEMPAMPASLPAPEMDKGNPVTVSVSMNASGKEHVADLLDMMKNAGLGSAEPVGAKMLSPRMDMERLSGIMDEPGFDDKEMPLPKGDEADMEEIDDEIEVEGDYANEPDPEYGDMSDAIPDGNDLNRKKKSYAATQDGDNPMAVEAIKATLMKALAEKKMPMGPGPDGKKGTDDDKPAFLNQKTSDKKSKGGSKPKKGEVPPQFKKK